MLQDTTSSSQRFGMYKNFRVGVIKYFQKGAVRDSILVEVVEPCYGTTGNYYATYNLFVEFDDKYKADVEYSNVGDWILFGFYIQSFKSENGFTTILRLRHFERMLDNKEVFKIEINDTRTRAVRDVFVPGDAFKLMNQITNNTQFNEYGKR